MKTFKLTVATPNGNFFSGDIVFLSLRGIEGDLAIMAGHTPFITSVKPCTVHVDLENGEEKEMKTDGGLLTVAKEGVTLLSGRME